MLFLKNSKGWGGKEIWRRLAVSVSSRQEGACAQYAVQIVFFLNRLSFSILVLPSLLQLSLSPCAAWLH